MQNSLLCCFSGWSESRISLWMAVYMRNMAVKSTFPSKCLQSTVLSLSALSSSSFQVEPFPLTGGEF
jgi:hypothetical protein